MGIVGAIGGALISSSASKKATNAQVAAANADREYQRETRDLIRADMAPYLGAGGNALAALQYDLGLSGSAPTFGGSPQAVEAFTQYSDGTTGAAGAVDPNAGRTGRQIGQTWRNGVLVPMYEDASGTSFLGQPGGPRTGTEMFRVGDRTFNSRDEADAYAAANPIGGNTYGGYQASPGYQWRFGQGMAAIDASAANRGGLFSGATLQAANEFGQGLATEDFNNHINRLFSLSGMGQNAAGMQANAQTNFAQMNSNALSNIGNAQAAGAIAQGNAWNGALNNLSSIWGAQNNGGWGGINIGKPGSLFGGNSWG